MKIYQLLANQYKKYKQLSSKISRKNESDLKKKCLLLWKHVFDSKNQLIMNLLKEKFFAFQKKVFQEWRIITLNVLERKEKYIKLSIYKQKNVIFNYFTIWMMKFQESRKINNFFERQRIKKLSFCFRLWKKIQCQNLIITMMMRRRNNNLIQNCFEIIKDFVSDKKSKKTYIEEIQKKMLLKKYMKIFKKVAKDCKKIHDYVNQSIMINYEYIYSSRRKIEIS